MKTSTNKLLLSCVLLGSFSSLQANGDLGTLNISSSTIDDKFFANNNVSSSTVITQENISKINPTNIENILNTIPGITASNVGNDRVKIHIRGIDNQMYMGERPGVAVVIDGVPVQESSGKINLDLDNIASIKVIKGSASYLYGNDAIAGAIVITTKRPEGKNSSRIETEVGSFGFKRILASTNQSFEMGAFQLQGTMRDTDGYWDDTYLKHKSLNGKYQHYLNDTSDLTFGIDYTKRETGDGTSVHGETQANKNPKSIDEVAYSGFHDTKLLKTFITYSNDIDNSSNLMINISRYEDDTNNLTAATDTNRDGIRDAHKTISDEQWIQNTFKSEYRKSFDTVAIMAGVDLSRNEQAMKSNANMDYSSGYGTRATAVSKGTLTGSSHNDEDINALYVEIQNSISSNLTSTINFRHDTLEYDYINKLDNSLNADPSYNANTYRVGLNYKINTNNNIYTSYATGFRAPTSEQISGNINKLQSDPSLNIDTNLEIETTNNIEVGIRGKTDSFNYDASIYQLNRENYIGIRAGNYMWDSDEDADKAVGNLGDMRSRGFELVLNNNDKSKTVSFAVTYTYLDAKFKEYSINPNDGKAKISLNGNIVPRTSKHTLNFALDFKPIEGLSVSPEIIAKSSYFADESNNYKQPSYAVVNLRTEYRVNDSLELFGKIENILNKDYNQFVNVGYGKNMEDATIRVAAPRAYYAGLRYKF